MREGIAVGTGRVTRQRVVNGATIPFNAIDSPGAYLCNWSGHLLRIPERTVVPGDALAVNIVGREPLTVTKISADPAIALERARAAATELGLAPGF